MKKKVTLLIAAVLCIACVAVGAATVVKEIAAELRPDFTVVIDGVKRDFKTAEGKTVYPILYEGTTYLPIRAIGEIMDKKVYWYEDDKRIELKDDSTTVTDADVIITGGTADVEPVKPPEITLPSEPKSPVETTTKKNNFIGADKAKEIALQKADLSASDVKFGRVELDKDNGVWHYEVEFKKGYVEYDADIKADDGTLLSWETDIDD